MNCEFEIRENRLHDLIRRLDYLLPLSCVILDKLQKAVLFFSGKEATRSFIKTESTSWQEKYKLSAIGWLRTIFRKKNNVKFNEFNLSADLLAEIEKQDL